MKTRILMFISLLALGGLAFFTMERPKGKVVGVIVPMEHEALTQIVAGLKERLSADGVTIKVMNAQGDMNLQRAIVEQLVRDRCDLLVPIGTSTSQMTLSLAKHSNVVCLAADSALLASHKELQATLLDDELSASDSIAFLHAAFPDIEKITLLFSTSEKVAKEIPLVLDAAHAKGIEVQKLMVQTLPELYTVSQGIAPDSQAVFILKDHLIVSGIQTVAQQAEKRRIPVMTSDEGSVTDGGAFAIGVKEATIGRQGAEIVAKILSGSPAGSIAPQRMRGPFPLFVNRAACAKQGIDLPALIERAKEMGIAVEYTDKEKGA